MATNRYIGQYPVIGIRPIVDGRRGPMQLRESLEPQVWAMAEAAKKLFEENLYYSNGEPVKVVMADTCIGRVPETAACADKFRREGVDITLSVTPCWCYGSETMDMDPHTIKGVNIYLTKWLNLYFAFPWGKVPSAARRMRVIPAAGGKKYCSLCR